MPVAPPPIWPQPSSSVLQIENPTLQHAFSTIQAVLKQTGVLLPSLLLILVVLVILYPDRTVFAKPYRKELDIVKGYPLIGSLLQLANRAAGTEFEWMTKQIENSKVGFQISTPGASGGMALMFIRPEYVEYIQKTNFENYVKGPKFRQRFGDLLGDNGIFVADGHVWKTQRKLASHIFSVFQFRTWVQSVVHSELDVVCSLLDKLTDNVRPGRPAKVRLPDLFFRYTLSSFGKIAFSADIHCLKDDPQSLEQEVTFSTSFDFVQGVINTRFAKPWWIVSELFTKEGRQTRESVATIRKFGLEIIKERLDQLESGIEKQDQGGKDGKDLLDLFMEATTDEKDLLNVVLNFIIAGRDTTAQGLSWLFYKLIQHPHHIEQIRKEVRSQLLKPDGTLSKLEYGSLKELPYTQACFNEAIRLHPPVPKNGKMAMKDDVIIPQGPTAVGLPPIKVYAGEQVGWSDWVIARNPEVWGPDAVEFQPQRWFDEFNSDGTVKTLKNFGQWKFHVFNGGPRLCLGMTLANYEALSFVSAVIDRYDFGWATKQQGQTASLPLGYLNSVTHPSEMYIATVVARS